MAMAVDWKGSEDCDFHPARRCTKRREGYRAKQCVSVCVWVCVCVCVCVGVCVVGECV